MTASFSINANVTSVKQTYTQSQVFYQLLLNTVINNTNIIEASLPQAYSGNVSIASFNQPIQFVQTTTIASEIVIDPEDYSIALNKKIIFAPLLSMTITILFMFI